jgi:hypothetical protein
MPSLSGPAHWNSEAALDAAKLVGPCGVVADELHLIGRWAGLLVSGGMQQSDENDSALSEFVLQGDMSAGEIISGKLRLFDKEHFIFIQPETSTR